MFPRSLRVRERFIADVRAAQFLSLNDDMSGGAVMSQGPEVFWCVGVGAIMAPLVGSIYGRSCGELPREREVLNDE